MSFPITINPDLKLEEYSKILQNKRRLQIPNFFTKASAEYLYQLIVENKDWYLAYNEGKQYFESSMEQVQALTPEQRQQFMNAVYARAQTQFQYVFNQYYITQAIELNEQPGHPMHQLHHFINSEDTLEFMRKLTGELSIKRADSYATLYAPGHFLTEHDDRHARHDRVVAYTFGMTKNWRQNWGGHTAFFDAKGNIEEAYIPSFNTLIIFLIPQAHAVQQVAPFAGGSRTSYIGWLHR
ncbi:MAG: SM-20-related protein [Planctomycetota bacterium]|jgi:SM-20-related protein